MTETSGMLCVDTVNVSQHFPCALTRATGAYPLPVAAQNKFSDALIKESLFRRIGTTMNALNHG